MESYHKQDAQSPQPATNKIAVPTRVEDNFSAIFCHRVWQCGYPLILVLGLVGNALCLVAFAGPNRRPKTRTFCCVDLCAGLPLTNCRMVRCIDFVVWNKSLVHYTLIQYCTSLFCRFIKDPDLINEYFPIYSTNKLN